MDKPEAFIMLCTITGVFLLFFTPSAVIRDSNLDEEHLDKSVNVIKSGAPSRSNVHAIAETSPHLQSALHLDYMPHLHTWIGIFNRNASSIVSCVDRVWLVYCTTLTSFALASQFVWDNKETNPFIVMFVVSAISTLTATFLRFAAGVNVFTRFDPFILEYAETLSQQTNNAKTKPSLTRHEMLYDYLTKKMKVSPHRVMIYERTADFAYLKEEHYVDPRLSGLEELQTNGWESIKEKMNAVILKKKWSEDYGHFGGLANSRRGIVFLICLGWSIVCWVLTLSNVLDFHSTTDQSGYWDGYATGCVYGLIFDFIITQPLISIVRCTIMFKLFKHLTSDAKEFHSHDDLMDALFAFMLPQKPEIELTTIGKVKHQDESASVKMQKQPSLPEVETAPSRPAALSLPPASPRRPRVLSPRSPRQKGHSTKLDPGKYKTMLGDLAATIPSPKIQRAGLLPPLDHKQSDPTDNVDHKHSDPTDNV